MSRIAKAVSLGARVHVANGLTSLLVWLPVVLMDANAPFDLPYFIASPVLRDLLGLSFAIGLCAAAATAVLSSAILTLLSVGRRPLPPGAAAIPVAVAALVIIGIRTVNAWSITVPLSIPVANLCLFLGAAALVAVLAFGLRLLPSGQQSIVYMPGLIAVACFAASISHVLGLTFSDRRLAVLVLGAAGLFAQQVRVARLITGGRTSGASAAAIWASSLLGPALVSLAGPFIGQAQASIGTHADSSAPNVVVIMIDTLRADYTSLGSDDGDATPNLLAFARDGSTYFSSAVAAASSTAPSVKAFFTGRSPSYWGLASSNAAPPEDAWRFVESFKAAGYETAGISANPLVEPVPYATGFDYFWSAGGHRYWQRSFLLHLLYSGKRLWGTFERLGELRLDKIAAATIRDLASDWLDGRSSDAPFFLYLHFVEPHWPYYDRGYYEPSPTPELGFSYVDYLRLEHGDPSLARLRYGRNIRYLRHVYGEEVRRMDDELGLLIEDFERRGILDDSIVVVLGDHGEEFLEHNGYSHGHDVYEEQVHVPLLVHWPRSAAYADMPERVLAPVSLLDLAPTFVELLNLPQAPRDLDGHSLAPRLSGASPGATDKDSPGAPPVTAEASLLGRSFMAYREGDLKVRFQYGEDIPAWDSDQHVVMDLARDPKERVQLDEENSEVESFVRRARSFLRANRRQSR